MEVHKLENYSYEDYLEIDRSTPDEERVELIFGKIYMMSGASREHQDIVGNIFFVLKQLQKESGCAPVVAPYDLKIECAGVTNIVQPDILLYCEDEQKPCAIFEVLSPSTAYKDKSIKKDLYEQCGIVNYFVVDPLAKTIDKFLLIEEKYHYDRCYGGKDEMPAECLEHPLSVQKIFI
jgi:Uma2 family endonuclease